MGNAPLEVLTEDRVREIVREEMTALEARYRAITTPPQREARHE